VVRSNVRERLAVNYRTIRNRLLHATIRRTLANTFSLPSAYVNYKASRVQCSVEVSSWCSEIFGRKLGASMVYRMDLNGMLKCVLLHSSSSNKYFNNYSIVFQLNLIENGQDRNRRRCRQCVSKLQFPPYRPLTLV
jgi:hypothetical protein